MYQEIERKVANIMKWLPEFIEKNYDERRMGHLIENHLNIPDDRLKRRIIKEAKYSATSFYGEKETVVEVLKNILVNNAEEIAYYLADDDDDEIWIIEDEMPKASICGAGYFRSVEHDWTDGARVCSMVRIAVKKNKNCNEPIICSIYPIE